MLQLIKQNSDFQSLILDQTKIFMQQNTKLVDTFSEAIKHNANITNNNVNCHNKTFNLNLFLHEECKDAMDLSEFLASIKIQLADVEAVGELGYVNGISNPPLWKVEPNAIDLDQPFSKVDKIVIEATGGGSNCNDYQSENKIMKKIAKVITIDKTNF